MTRIILCPVLLGALLTAGCDVAADQVCFGCNGPGGQPGAGLVYGGQAVLEILHKPDGDLAQLNVWGRDFATEPTVADSLPYPKVPPMTCMDISATTFPRAPTDGSEFLDLGPTITVTPEEGRVITASQKMNFVDNAQYAIPLGYQIEPLDPGTVQTAQYYQLAFTGSDVLVPNQFYVADPFEIFSPPLGKAPVTFTHGQQLDISWDPANQLAGDSPVPDRTYPFVIILGPVDQSTGQVKWFCPMNDGLTHDQFTIPADVVDRLPPTGTLVMGQQTAMMAKYNDRRFDLIAIESSRSPFSFGP